MRKILLCLLLTAAVLLSLAACTGNKDNTDSDTTTAVTGAGENDITTTDSDITTEPTVDKTPIISGGQSIYKLIRSDRLAAGNEVIIACNRLQTAFVEKTGVRPTYETDWLKPGTEPTEYEILVGETIREESVAALEGLGENHYVIKFSGSKLIILGGSETATADAVDSFINTFLTPLEGTGNDLLIPEGYNYLYDSEHRIRSLTLLGSDIDEYSIVIPKMYSASEYRTAMMLQRFISENCGVVPEILRDNETGSEKEIRIGATNRSPAQPTGQTYSVSADDNALYITASSMFAYIELQDYLFNDLLAAYRKDISVENGFSHTADVTDTLSDGAENVLTKNGEVRVMFNNMYGNCNAELHPRLQRQQQLFELYTEYAPDVLGLQECNPNSRVGTWGIDKLLISAGYAEVKPSGASGDNYTPLFYNTATVKLIDSGYKRFSNGKNDSSKSYTWGVFELLSTGERFGVLSTHFWWKSIDDTDNAARLSDAGEVIAAVNAAIEKYNVTFVIGGDLNCNKSSGPYAKLINDGYTDPSKTAAKTENVNSHHAYPVYNTVTGIYDTPVFPPKELNRSIDHILVKGTGASMKLYEVVTDLYSLLSSDHCPIFVDFDLN